MLRTFFFGVIGGLCLMFSASALAQEPDDAAAEPTTEQASSPPAEPADDDRTSDRKTADQQAAQAQAEKAANVPAARDTTADPSAKPMPLSNPESVATSVSAEAPTDQEADEAQVADESEEARQARLEELLSLVTDNTTRILNRENPSYFALIKEVLRQTPEELRSKARENPRFNDFYSDPAKHRGELVHLVLNVRRVLPTEVTGENAAGVNKLYELWGWTDEAKAWMYCCITPELPPGFPTKGDVAQRVELTGYFFKMLAYQPGDAAPNARNLVAPLIIGRITPAPKAQGEVETVGNWPYFLIGGFALIMFLRILMQVRLFSRHSPTHRNYHRRPIEPLDADTLTDSLSSDRGLPIRNADE